MSAVLFDTHAVVKTLESAGMPAAQAEAVSAVVQTVVNDVRHSADMATKADVAAVQADVVAARNDVIQVRADVQALAGKVDGIRGELSAHRWVLGFIAAGVLSLVLKSFF